MMGNATVRRYTVTNLTIASITAVTTLAVSIDFSSAGFVLGQGVLVTPRSALTDGIAIYGHIVDADTLAIDFVNASAGAINPADTFDFDVFVFGATGMVQQTSGS